jgi:hypothetical protein
VREGAWRELRIFLVMDGVVVLLVDRISHALLACVVEGSEEVAERQSRMRKAVV